MGRAANMTFAEWQEHIKKKEADPAYKARKAAKTGKGTGKPVTAKKRSAPLKNAMLAKGFTDQTLPPIANLKGKPPTNTNVVRGMQSKGFSNKSLKKIVRTAKK